MSMNNPQQPRFRRQPPPPPVLVDPQTGQPLLTGDLDQAKKKPDPKTKKEAAKAKSPVRRAAVKLVGTKANRTSSQRYRLWLVSGTALTLLIVGSIQVYSSVTTATPNVTTQPTETPIPLVTDPTSSLDPDELEAARQRVVVNRIVGQQPDYAARLAAQFGYGLKIVSQDSRKVDEIVMEGTKYAKVVVVDGIVTDASF